MVATAVISRTCTPKGSALIVGAHDSRVAAVAVAVAAAAAVIRAAVADIAAVVCKFVALVAEHDKVGSVDAAGGEREVVAVAVEMRRSNGVRVPSVP